MGQQHRALQRKQCQLRSPLLRTLVQADIHAGSGCQAAQNRVPGQSVKQVQGTMIWRQQVGPQVRQALCIARTSCEICRDRCQDGI